MLITVNSRLLHKEVLTGFLCSEKTQLLHIFENFKPQLLHKPLAKKAKKRELLEHIQWIFASFKKFFSVSYKTIISHQHSTGRTH